MKDIAISSGAEKKIQMFLTWFEERIEHCCGSVMKPLRCVARINKKKVVESYRISGETWKMLRADIWFKQSSTLLTGFLYIYFLYVMSCNLKLGAITLSFSPVKAAFIVSTFAFWLYFTSSHTHFLQEIHSLVFVLLFHWN